MEGNTFDRIIKRLGADASRRVVLAGLIGTTAAALTGASASEAKRNNNRRRNNGNNGQGAGTEKVQICHRNNGRKEFQPDLGWPSGGARTSAPRRHDLPCTSRVLRHHRLRCGRRVRDRAR